ncbi:DUF2867 domain-containing protein [Arenimonas sp. MALMAid1274]|uniref:DUF2867 domain-containing protein n=1 Tax=Arenimonas sp. MALMAid1274 TaxID=3411630 RepID=UPI003BA1442D
MDDILQQVASFPSVTLASASGGLPIEVSLIAQLGVGGGDALVHSASRRQRGHAAFVDALDEPSVRIGAMDLERGDASSLYTFAVGPTGHPFHRHAGHRVFTAISGSGGARLRFSTASDAQVAADPRAFVRALRHVHIPPDCLFTVRFGGGTWHQFLPLRAEAHSPALFAISCHTNELGGDLPEDVRARVAANAADIPTLTQVLPPAVQALLDTLAPEAVHTTALSLEAPPQSLLSTLCAQARRLAGPIRGRLAQWQGAGGFQSDRPARRAVRALAEPPRDSLLRDHLPEGQRHQDSCALTVERGELPALPAPVLLASVLEGFLERRPVTVAWMMATRNVLVKPLRLRTSPLGCPVSSLLSRDATQYFAGRFPVLDQRVSADGRRAQVLLGADDRHLRFRSCVGVEVLASGDVVVTLGTRVQCLNTFGRVYMALIDRAHRRYISPALLRPAVEHALATLPVHAQPSLAVLAPAHV